MGDGGGGVYFESYTREARFVTKWDQHAIGALPLQGARLRRSHATAKWTYLFRMIRSLSRQSMGKDAGRHDRQAKRWSPKIISGPLVVERQAVRQGGGGSFVVRVTLRGQERGCSSSSSRVYDSKYPPPPPPRITKTS